MLNRLKRFLRSSAEPPPLPPAPPAPPPPLPASTGNPNNPSKGVQFTITVTSGSDPSNSRTETVNLLTELHAAMARGGRECFVRDGVVGDVATGMAFRPGVVSFQPQEKDLSLQMCTVVEIWHPELFPNPVFEYQHSHGENAVKAVASGFDGWMELDFPPLVDALSASAPMGTSLEMTFPGGNCRRVVLGPVKRWGAPVRAQESGAHPPFCPCCLFTSCVELFQPLLKSQDNFAIRLLAIRNTDGPPAADCRVNGEDHSEGRQALEAYVGEWPGEGFEMRKQYVIIQNKPGTPDAPATPA